MSNKLVSTNAKKAKRAKKDENSIADIAKSLVEYAVAVFVIAIAILVPLYLKDGYHGVGDCKYELYRNIMIIGLIVTGIFLLIYWLMSSFVIKDKLSLTDAFVLAFALMVFISAIAGGNFKDCIKGYSGWYMGILMLLSFVTLYFLLSRFGRYQNAILIALLATAFITYVIAILHRMKIDPIGTYGLGTEAEISDYYKNWFLSTLGQSSWNSAYLCTLFPIGMGIYCVCKKSYLRILSGVFVLVGFMTLVTQNGDSAYFAMLGFMLVLFALCADDSQKMVRFWEMALLFFVATRIIVVLFRIHPFEGLQLDTISSFFLYHKLMWFFGAVILMLWLIFLWCHRRAFYPVKAMKITSIILIGVTVLVLLFAIGILIAGAKGVLPQSLANLTEKIPYLVWNEQWGNGRGRTWAFSAQMYQDMSLKNKLLGVGPDGYAPYAYAFYQDRLSAMWGDLKLTNAHNEWFTALINYGIIGTIAYIGIFVSAIVAFIKQSKNKPILIGFVAAIVSYMCHNLFCYQTVCCTPFIFMVIGMGMYLCRKSCVES